MVDVAGRSGTRIYAAARQEAPGFKRQADKGTRDRAQSKQEEDGLLEESEGSGPKSLRGKQTRRKRDLLDVTDTQEARR